jgi:hypothetical protein
MRIYDSRLGRFLSVDPLSSEYNDLTPYQFASNRPIDGVDLDGEEWWSAVKWLEKKLLGTNHLEKIETGFVKRATELVKQIIHSVKDIVVNPTQTNTATGGLPYAKLDKKNQQEGLKRMEAMSKALIADYVDLFNKASQGDDEAIGGVIFEVAMLIVPIPGGAEVKGFGTAAKAANTFEKLLYLSEKTIARELTENTIEVIDKGLLKSGWEKSIVSGSENAIEHTVYTKVSKSGKLYTLDYHPGKGIHGGDYWKGSYQKPAKTGFQNKKVDLFRVGKNLKKIDKLKAPTYSNGQKVGGTKTMKEIQKK